MILSRKTLHRINDPQIVPPEACLNLPEKVIQFGTGVLLRGLPDYFIDKANRKGIFNGRIVVVKSTASGSSSPFDDQEGLYTHVVRGIDKGAKIDEVTINSSISRVLSAAGEWKTILACAHQPEMNIVISNTTEVGIQLDKDDRITNFPPVSFPGKLTAFLYERYTALKGSLSAGMVIIPTELIVDNGKKLKAIVLEMARINGLGDDFIAWLGTANNFCNSLVDRIVPGKPDERVISEMENKLGYQDSLLIVSEVYRLWAIEGDEKVKEILSFAKADSGVVIAPDIEIYRELKLRLLNGTHTLSCGLAFLAGFETVKKAMDDPAVSHFVSSLMKEEIAPAIPYEVSEEETSAFSSNVIDRFRNPHIEHLWLAITAQFSAKLKMRVVPVLLQHYKKWNTVPEHIALGFAGYLLFMRAVKKDGDQYSGESNGLEYRITDDQAALLYEQWQLAGPGGIARSVLSSTALWDTDLSLLPGFADAVSEKLTALLSGGTLPFLQAGIGAKA